MPGAVVLIGGDEFSAESNALNKAALNLTRQTAPRLVIVPVATDNPRKAAQQGTRYLTALGGKPETILLPDADTANKAVMSAAMESTDAIYLTDGNPLDAVEILADTEALAKLRHAWQRGVVIAASGASAMALCDLYWDSGAWEKGLGLLKGIVVLPHHQLLVGRFSGARLREGLPPEYTILGLDDSTGIVVTEQHARVLGSETVTVYQADHEQDYSDGDSFDLTVPLS